MRSVTRRSLSMSTMAVLSDLTKEVAADPKRRKLPQGRRDTLLKLQLLLLEYDRLMSSGEHQMAHQVKQAVIHEPFPAVLGFLVDLSRQPGAEVVLRSGVTQAIQRHRVAGW